MEEAKTKRLADILSDARAERGYTYAKLAKLSKLSYPTVWDSLNGKRISREPELLAMAKALELDGELLLALRRQEYDIRRQQPRSDKGKRRHVHRTRYSIYDNATDLPIIIDGTAEECAAAMGIKLKSFWCVVTRARNPKRYTRYRTDKRWTIYREDEI